MRWNGEEFKRILRARLRTGVERTCKAIQDSIKRDMPQRTSKPGEAPGIQTGIYRRSIQYEVHPINPIGRVGTNDERGPWLELGTGIYGPRGQPYPIPNAFGTGATIMHPGMEPRPHIVKNARKVKRDARRFFQAVTRDLR